MYILYLSCGVYIDVERPPIESLCDQEILKPASLTWIKVPNWMGKTSLMAWIRDRVSNTLEKAYRFDGRANDRQDACSTGNC
ncbi:MAG: hypothetical protein F6J96_26060 [Symploca sp. SIO1C2]|nr:hypothetical protein [Symploca sp. SIO1C2]